MLLKKVKTLRRLYLAFSFSLGIVSPLLCWYLIPDFNPIQKPLSYFGVAEPTFWYWNVSLLFIAVALYVNASKSLSKCMYEKLYAKVLQIILLISFVSLCLTAIVSMNYLILHRIAAISFFLAYNLFVFLFGLFRSLKYVRKGLFSIVIGSLMLLSSLLLIPFPSYGVFEIVYFILLLYWNAVLFKSRVENEDRKLNEDINKQEATSQSINL